MAERGLAPFPCDPRPEQRYSKRPLTEHGFCDASLDPAEIEAWWRRSPNALVGLPTSTFWVLDIDVPIALSVEGLEAALGRPMSTLMDSCGLVVSTPRGGWHFYFRRTPGVAIRNAAGDISGGVDTRGHDAGGAPAGYVIAAGTQMQDGRSYRIVSGSLEDLVEAPRGLLYLAALARRERDRVRLAPDLRAAFAVADPPQWRRLFEQHEAALREEAFKHAIQRLPDVATDAMRRQALGDLDDAANRLASLTDGRSIGAFKLAAGVGKYVAHDVMSADEVLERLMAAWIACGGAAKRGPAYGAGQIRAGIAKASNDPLPIIANRFRCFR